MATPRTEQAIARLADLTPRQIVAELDRYIVGQADAKKSVAIALRNRWRRQRAPEAIRNEISPNNIILIGPTGTRDGQANFLIRIGMQAMPALMPVTMPSYDDEIQFLYINPSCPNEKLGIQMNQMAERLGLAHLAHLAQLA